MSCVKCAFVFVLFTFFGSVTSVNNSFQRSSILYGISTVAEDLLRKNESENHCYKQLTEFYEAVELKRVWAYKMMDVSGRPGTNFLVGNNGWTGLSTLCDDLTNQEPLEVYHAKIVQLVTEYDFPPYDVGLVTAFLRHDNQDQMKTNTPYQNLINLGLCTPLSCTGDDIKTLLETFLDQKLLTFQKLYDINFKIEAMKTVDPSSSWLTKNPTNIAILTLIIGAIVFVSGASYYHLNIFEENMQKIKICNNANTKETCDEDIKELTDPVKEIFKATTIFEKIILCFSWSNTSKLILKSDVPQNVEAINGMMFFTMLGISVYHFLVYGAPYTKTLALDFIKYEGFWWQIVANSSFSIDSFLFLSGCLVSYKFYSTKYDILLNAGVFTRIYEMFKMIAEKLMKSIPVYTMWLLWSIFIFSYLDSRWSTILPEKPHEACPRTWWKNLLFINNLESLHSPDTCMSWSWLIAAEMQYFILNILVMIVSTFSMTLSTGLTICMILYCIFSTGTSAYNIGYIHTLDQQIAQLDQIYHLPWNRIGPYAVGMLTGMILFKLNGKLSIRKKFIWLGWTLAPLINLYLIFGLYGIKPSAEFSSIYISVARTAWAIGLAWILVTCSTGDAGFINVVLSFGGFKIFYKQFFSSYLLMVLSIYFICNTFETTVYLSTITYICQIFSFALFPYFINSILTMFYELPFELLWETFYK